jgi:microcystin-dependent protein
MADTFTAHLNLTLPEIGASDDTWGNKLNDDLAALDALFGSTGAGSVIVRDSNDDALVSGINLTKAAGNARLLKIKSGTALRWDVGGDATAESGSNAGSKFKINRYDDAGSFLGSSIIVDRDTGLVTFETTPKVGSNTIWHAGNDTVLRNPVGGAMFFTGSAAPTNWLFAFGQVLSQTTYADLFAVVGSTYNIGGEGAGNFRMPDLRDVVVVGKGNMGGSARGLITIATTTTLGQLIGAQNEQIAASHLPPMTATTTAAGAHNHTYDKAAVDGVPLQWTNGGSGHISIAAGQATSGVSDHNHDVTINAGSPNTAHSKLQPGLILNVIVRAFP